MEAEHYETKDLYFAAFLDLRLELVGSRKQKEWNPRKKRNTVVTYFIFKASSRIEELKSKYFGGSGQVSARAYADSINNLKALIYT